MLPLLLATSTPLEVTSVSFDSTTTAGEAERVWHCMQLVFPFFFVRNQGDKAGGTREAMQNEPHHSVHHRATTAQPTHSAGAAL